MSSIINKYIDQVRTCFPVYGKAESDYLARLSRYISDYFSEQEPASLDEISRTFGTPYRVVEEYLSGMDTEEIIKRVRIRRVLWISLFIVQIIALLVITTCGIRTYLKSSALQIIGAYEPPLYSSSQIVD